MKRGTFGFPLVSPCLLFIVSIRHELSMSNIPGYEAALNAATLAVPCVPTVRYPWEKNRILKSIFAGADDVPI